MIVVESGHLPDIGTIIAAALTQDMSEICPYVEGYCGEHIHDYPDVIQKASQLNIPGICVFYSPFYALSLSNCPDPTPYRPAVTVAANTRRRNAMDREAREWAAIAARVAAGCPVSSAATRVRRRQAQANAVAGLVLPQTQAPAGQFHPIPTQVEIDLLTRLANGDGLSPYDTEGFIERCDRCGRAFLASLLSSHIILSHQ